MKRPHKPKPKPKREGTPPAGNPPNAPASGGGRRPMPMKPKPKKAKKQVTRRPRY